MFTVWLSSKQVQGMSPPSFESHLKHLRASMGPTLVLCSPVNEKASPTTRGFVQLKKSLFRSLPQPVTPYSRLEFWDPFSPLTMCENRKLHQVWGDHPSMIMSLLSHHVWKWCTSVCPSRQKSTAGSICHRMKFFIWIQADWQRCC